ncbi:hypothetical protein ACLESO_52965, partial [Pyxidicoccus sp. 3LG]
APDRAALRTALEEEARFQAESYGSADLGEGLAAARRAPRPRVPGAVRPSALVGTHGTGAGDVAPA